MTRVGSKRLARERRTRGGLRGRSGSVRRPGNAPTGFFRVWGGQSVSVLLSGATTMALSLWVFDLTGSATQLAAVLSIRIAASIVVSPFAGVLADRMSRKRLVVASDLALAALAVALAAITSSSGFSLALVFAVLLVGGVVDSVLLVTLAASLRDMRKEADLTRAAGVVGLLDRAPAVVAPALGAALYLWLGLTPLLLIDAVSFAVAAVAAGSAKRWTSPQGPRAATTGKAVALEAVSGVVAIWRAPEFRRLQLMNSLLNVLNGLAVAMVATFILTAAMGGDAAYGAFSSATALGLALGALGMIAVGSRVARGRAVLGGLGFAALVGRVVLGLASHPTVWVASGLARAFGQQVSNVALTALWAESATPASQGRLFGGRRLLGQALYPPAVLLGGVMADALTHRQTGAGIVSLGILELLIVSVMAVMGVVAAANTSGRRFDVTPGAAASAAGLSPRAPGTP